MSGESKLDVKKRERDEHYRRRSASRSTRFAEKIESWNRLLKEDFTNLNEGNIVEDTLSSSSGSDRCTLANQEDHTEGEDQEDINIKRRRIPRAKALDFFEEDNLGLDLLFTERMAVPVLRAIVYLTDFTSYSGLWDEDLDAHKQCFEVTCVANEIIDDDQKLHIFPATLKEEAASWYGNLDAGSKATYALLSQAFLTKFRRQGFQDRLAQ